MYSTSPERRQTPFSGTTPGKISIFIFFATTHSVKVMCKVIYFFLEIPLPAHHYPQSKIEFDV